MKVRWVTATMLGAITICSALIPVIPVNAGNINDSLYPKNQSGAIDCFSNNEDIIDDLTDSPAIISTITVDLRATGIAGDILNVDDYRIPSGTVTEDGFTLNTQTALGALTYCCQQSNINIELAIWQQYVVPLQICSKYSANDGHWGCFLNQENLAPATFLSTVTDGDYIHFYNTQIPEIDVDLRVTGTGGDIITTTGCSLPFGKIVEDGFVIDIQSAMGALVYYCQQNDINVTLQSNNYYSSYIYQIGDDAGDEFSWTYRVDGSPPSSWAPGWLYALNGGELVHWTNHLLDPYSLHMLTTITEIGQGYEISVSVRFNVVDGPLLPAYPADVYVSDSLDGIGNPVTPGVSMGQNSVSGRCTFIWNEEGTYYPYAEWNGLDTLSHRPLASFSYHVTYPGWDVNQDGFINMGDIVRIGLHWGETGTSGWIPEDVNNDGTINMDDIVVIGIHWGE